MKTLVTFGAACLALCATPAAAVVKIATYAGTVSLGYDQTGEFGPVNTDLTGLPFVARYTYDTNAAASRDTDGVSYDILRGGNEDGNQTPLLDASLTIGGVTRHFTSQSNLGYVRTSSGFVEHSADDVFFNAQTSITNSLLNQAYTSGAPTSLADNANLQSGLANYGYFQIRSFTDYGDTLLHDAFGYLGTISEVSYSVGSAVPEPATWALMLGGFGLVGIARRRRRWKITA